MLFWGTWKLIPTFTHRIYMRLFELAPEARGMFNPTMKLQEEKLVAMLARLVGSLSDDAKFKALTQSLGRTHKDYKVQPVHYTVLKQAIVMAFQDIAPESFTPPTLAAWSKAYDAIADAMIRA